MTQKWARSFWKDWWWSQMKKNIYKTQPESGINVLCIEGNRWNRWNSDVLGVTLPKTNIKLTLPSKIGHPNRKLVQVSLSGSSFQGWCFFSDYQKYVSTIYLSQAYSSKTSIIISLQNRAPWESLGSGFFWVIKLFHRVTLQHLGVKKVEWSCRLSYLSG